MTNASSVVMNVVVMVCYNALRSEAAGVVEARRQLGDFALLLAELFLRCFQCSVQCGASGLQPGFNGGAGARAEQGLWGASMGKGVVCVLE